MYVCCGRGMDVPPYETPSAQLIPHPTPMSPKGEREPEAETSPVPPVALTDLLRLLMSTEEEELWRGWRWFAFARASRAANVIVWGNILRDRYAWETGEMDEE